MIILPRQNSAPWHWLGWGVAQGAQCRCAYPVGDLVGEPVIVCQVVIMLCHVMSRACHAVAVTWPQMSWLVTSPLSSIDKQFMSASGQDYWNEIQTECKYCGYTTTPGHAATAINTSSSSSTSLDNCSTPVPWINHLARSPSLFPLDCRYFLVEILSPHLLMFPWRGGVKVPIITKTPRFTGASKLSCVHPHTII